MLRVEERFVIRELHGKGVSISEIARLLHHSTTIDIRGQSLRLREKRQAGVFHNLTATPKEG